MVDTEYMNATAEQGALNLQNALRGCAVDHPVNRLGEIVETHPGLGEIRRATLLTKQVVFFAWSISENRAFSCPDLRIARETLGAPLPVVGMDEEGFGKNRLGTVVERVGGGEIRKYVKFLHASTPEYFAWEEGATGAIQCWSLASAREVLGKVIDHPAPTTKPKSANEQNRKGYKAK